jgi:malonate-semialdehyde dehydrogenase (acetylating)/methylmalonate-semialdehyde dehydrogenase
MTLLPEVQYEQKVLKLLIQGQWKPSQSTQAQPVMNPATGSAICNVPFSLKEEIDQAVESSASAFEKWKEVPLTERVQYLFKLKNLFENHFEELARINTQNHGKTIVESRGDIKRAIENVEAAVGAAYTLSKGEHLDQITTGIDEGTVKEPLGVFALVCPFNFPIMIPFWFLPYAIVLGCTVVVKPSEVTPVPMTWLAELIQDEVKFPPGVINLVQGSRETVEQLIAHPKVKGVTFVGSTPVGRQVYKLAGEHGKRAIVQGGAKNSILIMPDADPAIAVDSSVSSIFGNTGQRCLAGANLIVTKEVNRNLIEGIAKRSSSLKLGYGLDESTEMGPLTTEKSKERVLQYIDKGLSDGAKLVLDGRKTGVKGYDKGFFLGASVFTEASPDMSIAKEEIFGPIASVVQVSNLDQAIDMINTSTNYGNAASIFTSNGYSARKFRRNVRAGNIGINVGVPAPMAFFPFGGMRDSFFGILHGQMDSVNFFTDRKVIISRWS